MHEIELRPQPAGIFALPAAHLILPPVADASEALQALLRGDGDACVPPQWQFFVAAARGDVQRACELLPTDDQPLTRYNRFVLQPTAQCYDEVKAELTGALAALLEVAAYCAGVVDAIADEFQLDGELLAVALAAAAAADLERQQHAAAMDKLRQAADACRAPSPLLAALLLSECADVLLQTPDASPAAAAQLYREAIQLADGCPGSLVRAELWMKLGMVYQNSANGQRGALLEAVSAYQAALHGGITAAEQPELFAQLQNNLGLAYLSMPAVESSSQLRTGVAIQSFRHALTVYEKETHPDMWASVSMNLANALQYAPSSHPQDNLIQAVEIYEDVLQVRSRARDPVAYALVLLNQANALAHLGVFKPALEKLAEAYKLFHWYEQVEQADAAQQLVDQINQRLSDVRQPAASAR